jgi:arabinofuranosyltransferase
MVESDVPRSVGHEEVVRPGAPPTRSKALEKVAYGAVLAVYLVHALRFRFVCDDAYISFRYARNLVAGLGLRFNPGESPPVEGFSNFLWVLVMSLFEGARLSPAVASCVLSVLCGALLVVLLMRHVRREVGAPPGVVFCAGFFFVLFPPVAVWSMGGLETVPFALLVFVLVDVLLAERVRGRIWWAGLAGLGVVLLRADGFAWVMVVALVAGAALWLRGQRDRLLALWPSGAIVLAGFVGYLCWRHWYFGAWMSNTAYVKADLTGFTLLRGWNYAVRFVMNFLSVGVILLASVALISRPRGGPAFVAAMMVGATFAAAILVGGDFMPFSRMFVVGAPFLTVLLACVLSRLWSRAVSSRLAATVMGIGCLVLSMLPVFNVYPVPTSVREMFRYRWSFFRETSDYVKLSELAAWRRSKHNCEAWARIGKALKLVANKGDSLVQGGIGAIGYYSGLHIYDQAGLVDREVARRPPAPGRRSAGHDKAVPIAYFEKYKPTFAYAVLALRGPDLYELMVREQAIYLDHPSEGDMIERYRPEVISLPPGHGFRRNEVLIVGRRIPQAAARRGSSAAGLSVAVAAPAGGR